MVVHYGFMDQPDIPQPLDACGSQQMRFNLTDASFFVGRMTIVSAPHRDGTGSVPAC